LCWPINKADVFGRGCQLIPEKDLAEEYVFGW